MLRLTSILLICLAAFPAFGQSASKYQVGTITEVTIHRPAQDSRADAVSYDVSIKVGNTIYVVLYTPPLGEETVKYVVGRDMLVLVGKSTIRYNDILGESREVPIESHKAAVKPNAPKPVSHGN